MKLRFFTWNVQGNDDPSFYQTLSSELNNSEIDILVLQECYMDYPIEELSNFLEVKEFLKHEGQRYVRIFISKSKNVKQTMATSFMTNKIRCVKVIAKDGYIFNLVGVHLYSKTGRQEIDQYEQNLSTGKFINQFKKRSKTSNTLIIGDLNHNPFDISLQSTYIFNALNDKSLIKSLKSRRFQSVDFPFYYNPMWNLLGDHQYSGGEIKVPGTYYWLGKQTSEYHWNLLDGVLLSNQMMDKIDINTLKIVTQINNNSLIDYKKVTSKVTILTSGYSDHLPVKFNINT